MFDIKALIKEVDTEVSDARLEDAKALLKKKKEEVLRAERILKNVQNEYHDLIAEIQEQLS